MSLRGLIRVQDGLRAALHGWQNGGVISSCNEKTGFPYNLKLFMAASRARKLHHSKFKCVSFSQSLSLFILYFFPFLSFLFPFFPFSFFLSFLRNVPLNHWICCHVFIVDVIAISFGHPFHILNHFRHGFFSFTGLFPYSNSGHDSMWTNLLLCILPLGFSFYKVFKVWAAVRSRSRCNL